MTKPNHTIDTICKRLGGSIVIQPPTWNGGRWWATIATCAGFMSVEAHGKTERAAKAALVRKLRDCAKAILSDEWEFKS